jgi:hypothetical protein
MGLLDSATTIPNAISSATSVLSGPASALSSIKDSVSGLFSGFTNNFVKTGAKLPLPNPLFKYASYTYTLGLGCLTADQLNNPDTTYRAGKRVKLICKSASIDPNNRVKTPYGKFEFYLDDIEIKSLIGFEEGNNTNALRLKFKVTEPYSMGLFMIACQQAAQELKHPNYFEAPYILTIDFKGITETGKMETIPGTSRQIPFNFTIISMNASESGSVYTCEGLPVNQQALLDVNNKFKSDVSAKGTTVQEVLQTGEKSIQAAANQFYQDQKKKKAVSTPDEVLILFPKETASDPNSSNASKDTENNQGATQSPSQAGADELLNKLGVSRNALNFLVQDPGECNELGRASMGYNETKKGDVSSTKDDAQWDPVNKINVRANNQTNYAEGELKFSQDTDIVNAINQTLINSKFIDETFDPSKLSAEGYRGWWRIDVQTYYLPIDDATLKQTGSRPKLFVYRVVPYSVHASKIMPPNTKAPGFDQLKKQAVKVYNYIYTGKNVDIIDFKIDMKLGFMQMMAADTLEKSQDVVLEDQEGSADEKSKRTSPLVDGNAPSTKLGTLPTVVKYLGTITNTDKQGGGGPDTEGTRAARLFHQALTEGADFLKLKMRIIGDPYFLAQSGTGNYTAKPTEYSNLHADGSVNYQNGEVDIIVNFRTTIDINQGTGLYNFGGGSQSAPVTQFSGLYQVLIVHNYFKEGLFTQELTGLRRSGQELEKEGQPYSSKNPPKAPEEPK